MSEAVKFALAECVDGRTLSMEDAHRAMASVMDGEA